MSFFIAKRRAFDPSCCCAVAYARRLWAQANDAFLPIDLRQKNYVDTATYGFLSLSHRYAMPAPPSGGAKNGVNPCLPLMRKVSARHVALTKGENYVSFDALNLWASKREFVIISN